MEKPIAVNTQNRNGLEVAVIGMSGTFPGAKNIHEFWSNLENGVESLFFLSDEELMEYEIDLEARKDSNYVPSKGGTLEDRECFDASFFGYTPKEATVMNPQLMKLHECAWEALEQAGYNPDTYDGLIGFYAGASSSFYWKSLSLLSGKAGELGEMAARILIDNDFLCTKISQKLNLKGPSAFINTACSTSLVTIHMGCRALLSGECDMALAGGVSVWPLKSTGYYYEESMILSPDGHCRAFDEKAKGTIGGEGVGIVVLKALEEAEADGDYIHAIIKSSVINNDGNRKVGFTAPSINGQAEVIRAAHRLAEVEPESITYVETHGTGTELGDTVEIEALKLGFNTGKKGFCAIGSVKTNIGHLDHAAGVTGFIKTVLALKHRLIPPSLHFQKPNPRIDFNNSPFYVNTKLQPWKNERCPLRAGVSSFGIGGTNAHVILEEAPGGTGGLAPLPGEEASGQGRGVPGGAPIKVSPPDQSREYQLILLSAKTQTALDKMTRNLVDHLKKNPHINLADAAYTLQVGRKAFQHRRMLVCSEVNEAIENFISPDSRSVRSFHLKEEKRAVVFMFPGLGSQYVNMGLDLYQTESVFREEMDHCFEIYQSLTNCDIKEILYPEHTPALTGHPSQEGSRVSRGSDGSAGWSLEDQSPLERGTPDPRKGGGVSNPATSSDIINQTEIAPVVIFIFEYALAKLLMKWGIKPGAMIGYSLGEYAAACLGGVFSLEDTLKLIVTRGRLIENTPTGSMLSVPLSVEALHPLLEDGLSIAIDNGPSCVVAGQKERIDAFEKEMKENRYLCTRLKGSTAIHSTLMVPILKKFVEEVKKVKLNKPEIPYISNVTGKWLTAAEATDPEYWANHLRHTVRFSEGMKTLIKDSDGIFAEIGPGHDLSVLSRHHLNEDSQHFAVNLVRHPQERIPDTRYLLNKIGRIWLYGGKIDWSGFFPGEKRFRIPLPTYPFESQHYRIEGSPFRLGAEMLSGRQRLGKRKNIADWFYVPSWKRSALAHRKNSQKPGKSCWLVLEDGCGIATQLVERLKQDGQEVIRVRQGNVFAKVDEQVYTINPGQHDDYDTLFKTFRSTGKIPGKIVYLWGVTKPGEDAKDLDRENIDKTLDLGFYSLVYLAQAIGKKNYNDRFQIASVTNNMQNVTGDEELCPGKATILGAVKVIPMEYANISCCSIDIAFPKPGNRQAATLVDQLIREFSFGLLDTIVAYRGHFRWVRTFEPMPLETSTSQTLRLKKEGVYLVTGGLGGIGYVLAQHLAKTVAAKLVLTGRSPFPSRQRWQQWLDTHNEEEPLSQKIRKVQALEQVGAQVMVCCADAANKEQMQQVKAAVDRRFGTITGVIHCAGLPDGGVIPLRTRENTDPILDPKVRGTLVLDSILKDVTLDFFICCSSITSILAPLGQIAYCAANAFLDAFAHWKSYRHGTFTVSIDWDVWKEVGMGVETARLLKESEGIRDSQFLLEGGILNAEGVEVFGRILEYEFPQVVISTRDLAPRVHQFTPAGASKPDEIANVETFSGDLYQRPELSTEYVAPRTEIEKSFTNILKKFFGYEKVGIDDNFFEFGVTSLAMIRINSLLRDEFKKDIPIVVMFEYPTIRLLGQYLQKEEKGETIINEIEQSEDFIQAEDLLMDSVRLLKQEVLSG